MTSDKQAAEPVATDFSGEPNITRQVQNITFNKQAAEPVATNNNVGHDSKHIFQSMSSDLKLPANQDVFIVRSMGDGKYEIMNISQVKTARQLGTEEAGREIRAKGHIDFLRAVQGAVAGLGHKIKQGVQSAELKIFRFLKLPLDLRYAVYDYTHGTLFYHHEHPYYFWSTKENHNPRNIRMVCKQIYRETEKFYFRSQFMFNNGGPAAINMLGKHRLAANIQSLGFVWRNSRVWNKGFFTWVATFPQLQILELVIYADSDREVKNKEKSYQNDDSIKRFSKLDGFDTLVKFRGLKKVTVKVNRWSILEENVPQWSILSQDAKDAEVQQFQDFLNNILTQDKAVKKIPKGAKKRGKGNAKKVTE